MAGSRAPRDHVDKKILLNIMSGIPLLYWDLKPECEILMLMWSFGPLGKAHSSYGSLPKRVFLKWGKPI